MHFEVILLQGQIIYTPYYFIFEMSFNQNQLTNVSVQLVMAVSCIKIASRSWNMVITSCMHSSLSIHISIELKQSHIVPFKWHQGMFIMIHLIKFVLNGGGIIREQHVVLGKIHVNMQTDRNIWQD